MNTDRNLEIAKEIATDMELYLELADNEVDEFATRLINRTCADKEDEISRLTAQVAMQAEALEIGADDYWRTLPENQKYFSATAETVEAWKRENDEAIRIKAIKECAELFGNRSMRNVELYVNDIEEQILSLLVPATKEKEPT